MTYRNEYLPSNTSCLHQRFDGDGKVIDQWTTNHVSGHYLDFITSPNSPRVNGKLVKKQNGVQSIKEKLRNGTWVYRGLWTFDQSCAHRDKQMPVFNEDSYESCAALFYSRAGDIRINVGQALAESQQTIDLVGKTANRIFRAINSLKRGRPGDAIRELADWTPSRDKRLKRELAKGVSNAWLELQYGWKPLLNDVYGAMISTVERPTRWRVTAKASRSFEKRYDSREWENADTQHTVTEIEFLTTVRCKCWIEVEDDLGRDLHQYGIDNPALLAWELLPYSFVVDWFLPIGDYLESLSALNGLKVIDPTTSRLTKVSRSWVTGPYKPLPEGHYMSSAIGSHDRTEYMRWLMIPSQPAPTFRNPLSPTNAASGIALLVQAFDRFR